MNEEQILLFSYRDVGFYWGKVLSMSNNNDRLSLRANLQLKSFIRNNEVIYYVTNQNNIPVRTLESNTFYLTAIGPTQVAGLIQHLRNGIMHREYEIISGDDDDHIELSFQDFYRGKMTMIGKAYKEKLIKLVGTINSHNNV